MEQTVVTHRRNVHPAADLEEAGPPRLRQQRDDTVRYAKGGPVYATDGMVGQLRNVVVDETGGEVMAIVISLRSEQNVVIPVDIVDHTAGDAIFLTEPRVSFNQRVEAAPVYERRAFSRANLKRLLAAASQQNGRRSRATVARVGEDFVETPGSGTATKPASNGAAKIEQLVP